MSAAARASHLVPEWAVTVPDERTGTAGPERRRLTVAAPSPDPAADTRMGAAAQGVASGARIEARLAPRAEPPAHRLVTDTPAHVRPPVLGSPEALARRPVVPLVRAGQPVADPAGPLPDPTRMCCDMVQAAVEGLRGARPLAQLIRWVTPEVYDGLALRAQLVQGAGTPPVSGRAGIRRIRVCRIGHATAEATVVVNDGPRVRAVAVRLEGHRGRWRATAMEIG
jgi:hypothetical protein